MEKRNICSSTSAVVSEVTPKVPERRILSCLRRTLNPLSSSDFSLADLEPSHIYGEPLTDTLSRQQVGGVSDNDMLVSAPDSSYDTDGTDIFDFTSNYGYDSFDRVQCAIDNNVSVAMAKASVAQAGAALSNPSEDPEDGKADTDNIVKPN